MNKLVTTFLLASLCVATISAKKPFFRVQAMDVAATEVQFLDFVAGFSHGFLGDDVSAEVHQCTGTATDVVEEFGKVVDTFNQRKLDLNKIIGQVKSTYTLLKMLP